jgi:hypothetical protein
MAKTQIKNYVFKPGIGAADNLYPNAYDLLSSNKEFIQKEANAWIQDQIDAGVSGFVGYTYNQPKCERDVGFVIDAYLYDLRYGGNEKLRNTIKYYWDQGVAQVDGTRQPEIQTHTFIGTLIKNYIFTNTAYSASNTEIAQTIDVSKTVANLQFTPTAATYNPSTGNMTLTIGSHSLTAGTEIFIAPASITFTCALNGNATTHSYPRASGVPNSTGKDPYYYAPLSITSVTATTITVNVGISSDTSTHTFVSATANSLTSGAVAKINTLAFNTVDVITNGLTAMPTAIPTGVGTIKIQGRYDLDQMLLITNATKNEIIYSFNNPTTGGVVTLKTDGIETDSSFPKYLQTTDAITTITLNYDTSNHSLTDELQIFVENIENGKSITTVRPHSFGTDAIERMRVAPALSMLDADFEYGLQPTKWAAIGTLRGYPSVYEIPGTDTGVLSVVTDASSGTSGVGQSLITVTTVGPHGFIAGTPITIKALEDSIVGAARAEGSFVINTVPTATTFTFFAKSKVGTTNGDVLSTTYTQLRQAGFYTGASIGSPTVAVLSNGTSGSFVSELAVSTGSTIIPFDGASPEIGAPLVDGTGAIPTGAQVTGIIDNSAGGGTYITPDVVGSYSSGVNTITVDDPTGIVPNLAVDRGDGVAIFVDEIDGNDIIFSGNFTSPIIGNIEVYTGISGSNDSPAGAGATFDVSRAAGVYSISLNTGGTNYEIGDIIVILGNSVGGATPTHDITITVTGTNNGIITTFNSSGTAFNGTTTVSGLTPTVNSGTGTNAQFDITFANNVFLTADITSPDSSTGYAINDIIIIPGNTINSNGTSPTNDAKLTVTGVGLDGSITSVSISGTAPNALVSYDNPAYTTSGSGIGIDFTVTRSGTTYSVVFNNPGSGFLATETITVVGAELGGTTPTNNLTITVDNVGGSGEITASSVSGTAVNSQARTFLTGNNLIGTGFDINVGLSGGIYSITVNSGGTNYGAGQTFTILGSSLIGTTPTNDLTITISTVNASGTITSVSPSGTANGSTSSHTAVEGANSTPTGASATFAVTRDNGVYSAIVLNGGTNYQVGNRIIIPGDILGGTQPANDLTLRVNTVSSGVITDVVSLGTADLGDDFDLISTILISESTTALLPANTTVNYAALATLEITFTTAHGLVPGNTFIVTVTSDNGSNNHALAAGSFFATEIPTLLKLRYQARAAGTIDNSTDISAIVYPRPDSFFIHRPYDGGVQLGTGGPQHGAQAIRQSKKYIRYQSGKGIMYTTGALFAPSYDIRSVTAESVEVGSLITVVTDDNDHGVQEGGIVRLLGIETPGYNSGPETATPPTFDYEVVNVIDERTFQIRAQRRLGNTTAVLGFGSQMSVVRWHGATVRSGIFDDQNGIFWEYDGTTISVNQRSGTRQLAGTIAMQVDNNLITGTNTRFRDQLKAGDRIVIKGMTHVVSHVNSQTEITVTPDWRGTVNITGTKANLVTDKKVKQSEFNLDRLDGTGPSGYDIDIAKMQMIGIQFSWYGAGFIDFMLRGSDGNFVFAHRMRNSNVNTEAFMRSGNLPVRYEVTNEGPSGKLASAMTNSQTTVVLEDSSFFPDSGVVYIDNEIISFAGNNTATNTLTGCIRAATFTNFQAGATRSYTAGIAATHDSRTGVILISQTITPLISHWGSAFLTDGGFDEDRGYIFSYAATGISVTTTKRTSFLIRLAPSVSNAIIGDLGERELLNRAQLLLQSLEITSEGGTSATPITGGIVVEGVLNPINYPINPSNISWSGLSTRAQGGQPSFAQIAPGGGVDWGATTSTATATVSADIDTGYVYVPANGTNENQSPIEFTDAEYNLRGPVLQGSVVYGGNGAAAGADTVYTDGTQGTYFVTQVRTSSNLAGAGGSGYEVSIRSTTGSTQRASNWPSPPLVRFVYRTFTGITNRLLFTKASWEASGATIGTPVAVSDTKFPAGTAVSNVRLLQLGSTQFYEVTFNQTSVSAISAANTVTFEFGTPGFALPGETVFSFIATPGERATVDFSTLKELTNTPLGGRGTYPNGPDVLAINVYKVSGAASIANIILKWGEAQA